MKPDDPAVLFEFKRKTEERLDRVEGDVASLREDMSALHRDLSALRADVTRTQRVALEIQSEMRGATKQIMAKLNELAGAKAEPSDG